MKPYQRYTSIVAAAALALTGSLQAQSSSDNNHTPASSSDTMSSSSSALANISRVSKKDVKQQFTAKDLIGAEVYDRAGEKIGDITDLALGSSLPAGLATSYNMKRNDSDTPSSTTYPNSSTPPGSAMPSTSSATSPTRPADRMNSGSSSTSSTYAAADTSSDTRVFISVGGLFGIGDDLVSVPVSDLSFNTSEDRFELSASKADVVALAEQKPSAAGYASGSSMNDQSTTAGKQAFGDEASKVQKALESNPATSSFAYKVSVTTQGDDTIELHGTVNTKAQRDQIVDAARAATTYDVDDKLEIQQ